VTSESTCCIVLGLLEIANYQLTASKPGALWRHDADSCRCQWGLTSARHTCQNLAANFRAVYHGLDVTYTYRPTTKLFIRRRACVTGHRGRPGRAEASQTSGVYYILCMSCPRCDSAIQEETDAEPRRLASAETRPVRQPVVPSAVQSTRVNSSFSFTPGTLHTFTGLSHNYMPESRTCLMNGRYYESLWCRLLRQLPNQSMRSSVTERLDV